MSFPDSLHKGHDADGPGRRHQRSREADFPGVRQRPEGESLFLWVGDPWQPPRLSRAGSVGLGLSPALPPPVLMAPSLAGDAAAGKETVRLLQPGGFPRRQRHCGEFCCRTHDLVSPQEPQVAGDGMWGPGPGGVRLVVSLRPGWPASADPASVPA